MKNILFVLSIAFLVACGNKKGGENQISVASIAGSWKLIDYNKEDYDFELKDCDKKSVWNFTEEKDEPLDDGTKVYKLVVSKEENCKRWFAFDSKWTVHNGKLFISSTSIGGVGGMSHAGLFDSVSFEGDTMVVKVKKATLTFKKAN